MTRHDLSHWPLVITVEQGSMSLDDVRAFIEAWMACALMQCTTP